MNSLVVVITLKTIVTITTWSMPLLIFPPSALEWLGFVIPSPDVFRKLLGMAYLSLSVGYVYGLIEAVNGHYPRGVVWMGIISNLGACGVLSYYALQHAWTDWGIFACLYMWASLIATGIIALTLIIYGPWKERTR